MILHFLCVEVECGVLLELCCVALKSGVLNVISGRSVFVATKIRSRRSESTNTSAKPSVPVTEGSTAERTGGMTYTKLESRVCRNYQFLVIR